ncbi:MAG: heat-inducible transcriptional repressor HrcA [Thermodesulfobacteriota bacterium]
MTHKEKEREKSKTGLSERSVGILKAIIKEHIATVSPVSSKAVAGCCRLGLSPASIRMVMADLEEKGYLKRPHPSSGAIPAEKSFRLYVNTLSGLEEPVESIKHIIRKSLNPRSGTEGLLRDATLMLSSVTSCAGFILAPKPKELLIKDVRFVYVDASNVLLVIKNDSGYVSTRLVRTGRRELDLDLEKISNYLNSVAKGLTLRGLRDKVREDAKNEKHRYSALVSKTLSLVKAAVCDTAEGNGELYMEGKANIFDQPEFKEDVQKIVGLFRAFEEKSLLLRILDRSIREKGVNISIGSECAAKEFDGLSIVTAPYGKSGQAPGALGVIGPVRMDYSRIIPLVDYAAESMTRAQHHF